MRALLLSLVVVVTACTDGPLDDDTVYRRLVDGFESEEQCRTEGDFAVCYQTLTLCENGRVTLDLVNRPQDGEYEIKDGSIAVAQFLDMHVEFDLDTQQSAQLPGRHPWETVTPLLYDCGR